MADVGTQGKREESMELVLGKTASEESDVSNGREESIDLGTELETEVGTEFRSTLGTELGIEGTKLFEKGLVVSGIMVGVTKVSIPELEEALP